MSLRLRNSNRTIYLSALLVLGLIAVVTIVSRNQVLASSVPGLVSQWSAEGNANDSVGSNNGTVVNGASFASGVVGQAFSLDGVDDMVRVPNSASLSFGPNSPMSISLWANRTGTAGVMHLVSKRSGCGNFNYQMAFDGSIGFGAPGSPAVVNTTLALNKWTHLVGTFDGSTFRFYMDGQLKATGAGTMGPVNSDDLLIGGAGTCGQTFAGLIDEVKLFNHALTPSEIQSLMTEDLGGRALTYITLISSPTSARVGQSVTFTATVSSDAGIPNGGVEFIDGTTSLGAQPLSGGTASITVPCLTLGQHLIKAIFAQTTNYRESSATLTVAAHVTDSEGRFSYWSADGNAVDSISGHNGILENGATFASGIKGQAFYLYGVDEDVRIPYSPDFDLPSNSAISVSLWAYRTGPASVMHLFGKRVGCGDSNYQMAFDNSGIGFGAAGGDNAYPDGLPTQEWIHLVGTYDGSTTRLYMNGQIVASATGPIGGINTADLIIGGSGTCSQRFAGLIDEISFYDHALTPTEVLSVYNTSSGQTPAPMILGRVKRADGIGVENVTVTLSGSATRTAITDATGWYTFSNLTAAGSYTVTASRSNYVFSPASQSINNLVGTQRANFSASPIIDLSVSLTDTPDPAIVGFDLIYTINITNNGPEPTSATLTSALSASGVFPNNGHLDDLGCSRDDDHHATCGLWVDTGTTQTFQLFVIPAASGTITNAVNVAGPFFDPNLSNNTVIKTTNVQALPVPAGTACVTSPSGAVAWYPGDGNVSDITAGHNGALQNGATFSPGIGGQAFSFDGAGSFVQVPDDIAWSFGTAPFTIALWAKFNDPNGLRAFIASDDGGGSQNKWIFWQEADALVFHINSPEYGPIDTVTFRWSPQPGQWYHLAVTRSGSSYSLYINGLRVNTANDDHIIADASAPLTIGQAEGGFNFDGLLDEIGIYNRALSQTEIRSIFNAGSYGQCKTASFTETGSDVTVQTDAATLTFDNVSTPGTTSVTSIDPATVGQVPGGFAVSNSVAYEIATTATFTASVTLAFKVPGPISQEDFDSLAILHNVNGTLVDVTATTPARDYSTLTIYATTNSFSPFYLARKGPHIKTLFDQTKAYKSGSTIPLKLQLLGGSNSNLSSSGTALLARDLRLMNGNTLAPVADPGNANPDYSFRYDSTLGGTGGGYIFNLSTKGLAAGQYILSFYVGSDRSFFYTVRFEVR